MTVVYATADDVRSVVARDLNRPTSNTAALDDAALEAAIVNAQSQVDAKLRRRYATPFSPVPALVKSITVDIAAWYAYGIYRQEKQMAETDPIIRRYNRAIELLCYLAEGLADLDGGDGGASAVSVRGGLGTPIAPRVGTLFPPQSFGMGRL
jgi:phage gp36-like protein